jgi:single-strand DNA-binding protein
MKGLNKITLIGNLGADPELKELAHGVKVVKVSLATTETWRSKDGQPKAETSWHPLVVWGSMADTVVKHCKKGTRLYVEGKLKTRHFDSKTGERKFVSEVIVDQIIFL